MCGSPVSVKKPDFFSTPSMGGPERALIVGIVSPRQGCPSRGGI